MSDYLFAKPSFLIGAASVIDLFGVSQKYNIANNATETDIKAIMSDWLALGKDFHDAVQLVNKDWQNSLAAKRSKTC